MRDMPSTILGTCILAGIAAAIGFCLLIGLTTHASHLADLKYAHEEMVACIQSDRPASDCRLIVYGSN